MMLFQKIAISCVVDIDMWPSENRIHQYDPNMCITGLKCNLHTYILGVFAFCHPASSFLSLN